MTPALSAEEWPNRRPGREFDALVAEHVMGWMHRADRLAWIVGSGFPDISDHHWHIEAYQNTPHFSTDIRAAWQVVEKLRCTDDAPSERYWIFRDCAGLGWRAELWSVLTENDAPAEVCFGVGETLPLAICHAALQALAREEAA